MADLMISRYRILRRLGAGGMAEVFLAYDTELDREVAIKVMSPALATDASKRKRFRNEARTSSGLLHPNICVIIEIGETPDKRPYIVMEYVEGETLDAVLQKRRLQMQEIVHVGIQVAHALEAARRRQIVHRDIKPSNIMMGPDGLVKVLDFGLAKHFGEETLAVESSDTSILRTRSGTLLGTPHYMSPEQALGLDLCHGSDLFSLGTLLYELVAGQRPFLGRTIGEIINHIINQKPEPLGLVSPFNTPSLEGIIFKCLEKKPADRYRTAGELAEALDQLRMEVEAAAEKPAAAPPVPVEVESKCECPPPVDTRWTRRRALSTATLAGVATVILCGLVFLVVRPGGGPKPAASAAQPAKSVAVLPFDNFSADNSSEYLSDGLTEEITTALSRIPGLKVAARNSAFTFKGKKEDLRKVGAALGVTTILEGSLRIAGSQMRVTAQLVNTTDGYQLWSETFDRPVDDVINVQEEIARKIADRLEVEMGGEIAARRFTPSREALQAYMQARHLWNLRGADNLEKAMRMFQQATALQPDYASAYSGLASCYLLLPEYAMKPLQDYLPQLHAAARRAQELDPKSPEALAVLAMVSECERDYETAGRLFREALAYNPNFATARLWYGIMLREQGRLAEAEVELSQAAELDPLSAVVKANLVTLHTYRRDLDRARKDCEAALELFPNAVFLHAQLASVLLLQARWEEAMAPIQRVRSLAPDSSNGLDLLARALVAKGDEAGARKILAELEDWKRKGYTVSPQIAMVHIALHEYPQAVAAANRALDDRQMLSGLLDDPALDPIRSQPGFAELVQRAGLQSPSLSQALNQPGGTLKTSPVLRAN